MSDFTKEIFSEILRNYNKYDEISKEDNYNKNFLKNINLKRIVISYLLKFSNYIKRKFEDNSIIIDYINRIDKFEQVYNLLDDEFSKKRYFEVLLFRILGKNKYKIKHFKDIFENKLKNYNEELRNNEIIKVNFRNWALKKVQKKINSTNIELYTTITGLIILFDLKHYEYKNKIKADKGDYVVDAGACWGNTSLYFADIIGKEGKVFAFEPIEDNLLILRKNLDLNSELKERIEIHKNVLLDKSNLLVNVTEHGPGSRIIENESIGKKNSSSIKSITIDEFVFRNKINKIDFIKMDIEGAELLALKGAINTIKKFKPKLAISIYHSINDFYEIPIFINSLNVGYKLYYNHYTLGIHESVLFAI